MIRKSLCREIQSVNQRLNLRQEQFKKTNERSKAVLKKSNPYLIIGIGLLGGVVTGSIGWPKAFTVVKAGFGLYPFLVSGIHSLISMRNG